MHEVHVLNKGLHVATFVHEHPDIVKQIIIECDQAVPYVYIEISKSPNLANIK